MASNTPRVDEALEELLSRRTRLWLYVISSTVLMVLTAILAANGDWYAAAVTFLSSFVPGVAAVNVPDGMPIGDQGPPGVAGRTPTEDELRALIWEAIREFTDEQELKGTTNVISIEDRPTV